MGSNVAIEARGVGRAYGDRVALRGVSVTLAPGETLAVLGPNGAGKTTLLRVLATLLRPSAGDLRVLGAALPAEAFRARGRIGYLGHGAGLYRDLSGRENLRFHARLHGLDAKEAEERIEELLERVGMGGRASEPVRELSAGMARRLAACRAVLHQPELLLLDEPESHLDPEGRTLLREVLGPAPGRARVLTSHEPEAALGEAEVALALAHDGSVAYAGPASGLDLERARAIYAGAIA